MNVLRSFLVFLLWLQSAIALKGDSKCSRAICVNATVSNDIVTYEMTLIRDPPILGWMAIGFGKSMAHTHMVIMWKSDDDTTILSQRYAAGYREPAPVEVPLEGVASIVNPMITSWHPTNSSTLAFQIPLNKMTGAGVERLIWAYSPTRPKSSDPSSHIEFHRANGHFTLDLSKELPSDEVSSPTQAKPIPSPTQDSSPSPTQGNDKPRPSSGEHDTIIILPFGPYTKREKVLIVHAFFMSFGFLVLLPAGSLIGRWGRTFTPVWFKAHQFSNLFLALPVITLGCVLGLMAVIQHESDHFSNAHEICGVVLVGLYYAQIFLGRYIHRRREKATVPLKPHPPLNIAHVVLGLAIIALAFFQIRSGLDAWEVTTGRPVLASWCRKLWVLWIVVLPLAYLSGLSLLQRQFRQERSGIASGDANYIALSENSSSRLFEVGEDEGDDGEMDLEKVEIIHGKASP